MTLNDELNALAEAHGYTWQTNESGDRILIEGHGFRATVEASASEDGIEYEQFMPEQDEYPGVIDSLMSLAKEVLVEAFKLPDLDKDKIIAALENPTN